MPEQRTVSVRVTLAAKGYFDGLARMESESRRTAAAAGKAFEKQSQDLEKLGKGAAVVSAGLVAAFVAMVKAGADFEAKMSQVSALGGEYSRNIGKLSDAAFTAGKAFGLSASQVADAEIELAKAGVSAKDILGGALPGALALASAGQIDVAKATSIASTAMVQFGKSGSQVPHIADLLAASANKSVGSVESVGDALNQSGLVAAQFGLSIEDTVGTLTAFSKAGLNGSDAGTSFKTMLLSLASPSKQAQAALDEYNITAYDSQGAFVGVSNLAEQLQTNFKGVSDANRDAALSTIFGTDAIRAANVLYKQGADITQGFGQAQTVAGAATLAASQKLDNLNGDLQKLKASFQNNLINSSYSSNDALRSLVQGADGAVASFSKLPKELQGSAAGVVAIGAVVTGTTAAFLLLTPKVIAARAAFLAFGVSGRTVAGLVGRGAGLAIGITAVASAFSNLNSQAEFTSQQLALAGTSARKNFGDIDTLFNQGDAQYSGVTNAATALKASFAGNGWDNVGATTRAIDGLTFGITHFSDAFKTNEGQFKALGEQLGALAEQDYTSATDSFNSLVDKLGGGAEVARQSLLAFPAYREQLIEMLKSTGQVASEQNILAAAIGKGGAASKIEDAQVAAANNAQALRTMAGSAADAKVDIDALSDTISGFGSVALDARSANRSFQAAVDDAAASIKKNGKTLDSSTEAGRTNQESLDAIAASAIKLAAARAKETGSTVGAAKALREGRADFIDAAVAAGQTRKAAEDLADKLQLIPSNVSTVFKTPGADAAGEKAQWLIRKYKALDGTTATIKIRYDEQAGGLTAVGGGKKGVIARASGGSVTGPGPKGKDSVLAYLAPGEHVLTSKDVDKMGGQAAVYAFRNGLQAFAAGGAIGDAQAARTRAASDARLDQFAINRATAALAYEKRQAARLQKSYEDIDGKKKNEAAKKAAKLAADAASNRVDAAEKTLEKVKARQDAHKQARDDAAAKVTALSNASEDFTSSERRGVTDPLSYVDQLRSMSRDDNYSNARRTSYAKAANQYEASLVELAKQSAAAAEKLDGLKSSAESMRTGIVSAVTGGFQASSSKLADIVTDDWTEMVESGWKQVDGIQYQAFNSVEHKGGTASGGFSADAIDAYYANGSNSSGAFALDLQQLANRGLDGRLLAEIAGYGVEQGAPIAKALLSATSGQISSINTNYGRIQDNGNMAAGIVTDYNYKALIQDAQANADKITKQIADDSEKLRKLIASAFGLTGYAVGTMNATRGWHLVGEQGPELLSFSGGEQVATAAQTRALMAGARTTAPGGGYSGPASVTIVDVDGRLIGSFSTAARSIAQQEISADATQDAILRYGGRS